jgi:WD40 repeat protein
MSRPGIEIVAPLFASVFVLSLIFLGSDGLGPAPDVWAGSQIALSGTVVQGPMVGATVTAFAVDPATGANLRVLGTTVTDSSGNFEIHIAPHPNPVRLRLSGGSFFSEQNGASIHPKSGLSVLLSSATTDISGISINPLTKFINALTIGKLEAGANFAAALASATATIESYYALSSNPEQLMPDYSVTGVGTDAGKLGLILGALINEDQHLCPAAPGGLVTALALDMANGRINGRWNGAPIPYCGGNLPPIAGTSEFQDALAGVQQLQYINAGFAFGGAYGPAGNILMNQIPPVTSDLLVPSVAAITAAISQAAPSTSDTSSPSMTIGRASATATLLRSGKVLIAGGMIGSTAATNKTELYDPATNTLSAGPPLLHARGEASATLLPNGNLLIVGGFDGTSILSSTEIYHPATNTFVAGPSLSAARFGAGIALLPNGKVLVAGGGSNGPGGLASTDIWDPATGSITAGASMQHAPGPCTATLLPNGKVFINGSGLIVNGPASNDISVTELYDPAANSMTEISLNTMRTFAASVLLPNGKVLIAGGAGIVNNQGTVLSSTQIYDPSLNAVSDGPSMSSGSLGATPVGTADGKALMVGGSSNVLGIDNVEIYDTASNTFTAGTPMADPRLFPTATLLPNGRVLIAGGDNGTNFLNRTELYQP